MTEARADTLTLGVCDYPEHVPASDWQSHARQQKAIGLTTVRLGEFSWARMESEEGRFEWQWLDDAIAIYQAEGLDVVLGTPTATPPAWLIEHYPQILPVDENGQVKKFGSRRHYDHASEVYRKHCDRIVTEMSERYGNHPAVVGWQTDNELGHEGTACSYGGASAERFPKWLKDKYQSLDVLNKAWGTEFWSQTYTRWEQIETPNLTAVRQANPSQVLDFKRFCSAMIEEFQQRQIDIIRRNSPDRFITHNFVIFSAESDLYRLSQNLDFVSWDSYPIGMLELFATWESEETKTRYARTGYPDLVSLNHDIYRGLKSGKDFWVMEQQCGHANWAHYNPLPSDGAVALWTAQAWAHGAGSVVYFRWRACHMAQEIMHSGLLKQNGEKDRGYAEVEALDSEAFPLAEVNARVAVLHDYDSLWIYDQQPHNNDLSYWHQFMAFYSALRGLGVDVDVIHPRQLAEKGYDVVVAPALTLLTDEIADALNKAAEKSTIVLGPRTAFRNASGLAAYNGQFELIEQLCGVKAGNFEALRPTLTQAISAERDKRVYSATLWCEGYFPEQAKATHLYKEGPLKGQAAVTVHGETYVIGALSDNLITDVLDNVLQQRGITTQNLPDGVRISRRGDKTLICNFNQNAINLNGDTISGVSFLVK